MTCDERDLIIRRLAARRSRVPGEPTFTKSSLTPKAQIVGDRRAPLAERVPGQSGRQLALGVARDAAGSRIYIGQPFQADGGWLANLKLVAMPLESSSGRKY